jgi:transposase
MPAPLSIDLRLRIVDGVVAGGSVRGVAARFEVSPSTVSKISQLWRESGSVVAKPMGGDRRSQKTEGHGEYILALVSETPDITLDEIGAKLLAEKIVVGRTSIWRLLERHDLSFKKNRTRQRARTRRRGRGTQALEGATTEP